MDQFGFLEFPVDSNTFYDQISGSSDLSFQEPSPSIDDKPDLTCSENGMDLVHKTRPDCNKWPYIGKCTHAETSGLHEVSELNIHIDDPRKYDLVPSDMSFTLINVLEAPRLCNVIPINNNVVYRSDSNNGIFLLIQLIEYDIKTENMVTCTFCKRCEHKYPTLIETYTKKFSFSSGGRASLNLRINEQCNHKSIKKYGSPSTLFFLKVLFIEYHPVDDSDTVWWVLFHSRTKNIKVVAPGKKNTTSSTSVIKRNTNIQRGPCKTQTEISTVDIMKRLDRMEHKMDELCKLYSTRKSCVNSPGFKCDSLIYKG